jgi:hypothetical protein
MLYFSSRKHTIAGNKRLQNKTCEVRHFFRMDSSIKFLTRVYISFFVAQHDVTHHPAYNSELLSSRTVSKWLEAVPSIVRVAKPRMTRHLKFWGWKWKRAYNLWTKHEKKSDAFLKSLLLVLLSSLILFRTIFILTHACKMIYQFNVIVKCTI